MSEMNSPHKLPAVSLALIVLTACSSPQSRFSTNVPEFVNSIEEKREQGLEPATPSRYHDQVLRLWHDKPDVIALQATKPKRIRVISAVVPKYPRALRKNRINGKVVVSIIVGIDGRVEEARLLESSDDRFNDSALEAVRRFTFLPAEGPNGPERDLVTIPLKFVCPVKQAVANPTPPSP